MLFSDAPLSRKDLKLLRSLKQKKYRRKYGLFLVEGVKTVAELLQSPFTTRLLILRKNFTPGFTLPENIPVTHLQSAEFDSLAETVTPEGLLAVAEIPQPRTWDPHTNTTTIYLDGLSDPGNLGTILRTALWFGLSHLLLSHDCTDPFSGKTVRSARGALFHLELHRDDEEYSRLRQLVENGYEPLGLSARGEQNLDEYAFPPRTLLWLGSESHGLRHPAATMVKHFLRIPGSGRAESLNVAAAFAIAAHRLHQIRPHRGAK